MAHRQSILGPVPLEDDKGYANIDTINSLDQIFSGKIAITDSFSLPTPALFLLLLGIAAALFLNRTIWGRYLFALGNNEDGARYSGINTDNMKIIAYVICSFMAGVAGILFAFELDSVQPAQTGEFYELYAIAAPYWEDAACAAALAPSWGRHCRRRDPAHL